MKAEEKDFQQVANEYAHHAIASLAEMLDALEHAQECEGKIPCPDCRPEDCPVCQGTGEVDCTEGKDSDEPESWHDEERAQQRIQEDPLAIEVRSDWHVVGEEDAEPAEFSILLGTGGPASRLIGELRNGSPSRVRFEYQDWFKPWTAAETTSEEDDVMQRYAEQFYFGAV